MYDLRYAYPYPQLDVLRINEHGQIEGPAAAIVQEMCIYILAKFNLTFVTSGSKIFLNFSGSLEMIKNDAADFGIGILEEIDHLPENITNNGPVIGGMNCKLISSPQMNSRVSTDGPESALYRMNIVYLSVACLSLMFVIYGAQLVIGSKGTINPPWFLYMRLMRQYVSYYRSLPFVCFLLTLSTLLLQMIFCSLLNTERTSITSFNRINTIEDALKYEAEVLISDISDCTKFFNQDYRMKVINFQMFRDIYEQCMGTGKCALISSSLEANIIQAASCTIRNDLIVKNPIYYSPPLKSSLEGMISSKRIPLIERNRIDDFTYRAVEMSLQKERGFKSPASGRKVVKLRTQMDPSEECMSKTLQTGISDSASLTLQYYKGCFILYAAVIVVSLFVFPIEKTYS